MWNLFVGVFMVLGGLAGTHVLVGTNSSAALVAVGAVVTLLALQGLAEHG